MKKQCKWHPTVLVKNVIILLSILLLVWMFVSWVQVVIFNTTTINPNEHYSFWNLWLLITQL